MVDNTDYSEVSKRLSMAQDADSDMRDQVCETDKFLNVRDGQWDTGNLPNINLPRLTLDKCNPIVDSIASQIEENEYAIHVKPADGASNKDVANIYNGLIRNIENVSNAVQIYNAVSRRTIGTGLSGCRVVQDYVNSDSFDQDLIVQPINDFANRVWFGPYEKADASDAPYAWVFTAMSPDAYDEKYPDGSGLSLSQDIWNENWWDAREVVIIAEYIYKVYESVELVLMTDGKVYEVTEEFESIVDELAQQNIQERSRKSKKVCRIKTRMMDGKGWITGEQDTVFKDMPVIQSAANFQIIQNKPVYWGAIDKLLDQQRVYNFTSSKQLAETALAPTETIMMTDDQALGQDYSQLNQNPKPITTYTHMDGQQTPYKMPGPSINQSLEVMKQSAANDIGASAGQFNAQMGNNAGLQSGRAIGMQIDKGDASNLKYVQQREAFICSVAKVIVNAIPATYDSERQIRIVGEDGAEDMETINTAEYDIQTGRMVELNDLSQGQYDVTCTAQKSFKNKQDQTASAFMELAQVMPGIMDVGADVYMNSVDAPAMKMIAERYREQMLPTGVIPQSQMSDEEIQQLQAAAQQPKEPTIQEQLGQAELMKGQAEIGKAQAQADKIQVEAASLQAKTQLEAQKLNQSGQKIELQADEQAFRQQLDINRQLTERMNMMADTMNKLVEATGAEGVAMPSAMQAVNNQAQMITGEQNDMSAMTNEQLMEVVRNG